jgi:NAD(P)H-flavin reductase
VRALVKETREVAKGTLFVVFDLQGEKVDFRPGQYFWVELPDRGYQDEKGLRRHISVATSPTEEGVLGLCTRLRDTAFKKTLRELEVGDEVVDVEQPKGDWQLPEDTSREYVFVAGGIGITVFRCMLRYIRDTGEPYRVTLVYSNRDREGTAFLDELVELERSLPNFHLVLTMTEDEGWEGESRFVGPELLGDHLEGELGDHTYLVAGPPAMVEAVVEQLGAAGIPEEQLLPDRFSGY